MTENQNILMMKPVKAFFYQDHDAHIAVHNMMIQDPSIAQQLGQNPQAQQLAASLQAHIAEHVGYKMRRQIEAQLGMPLPAEDQKLPPQIEMSLSSMMAQAANQIVQQNQAQMAMMQSQQQMQDPVVQMQMQELQLRQQDLQLKAQKQQIEAAAKADQIRVEEARIEAQKEIAAMQVAAQAAAKRDQLIKQQETEGTRMGLEIAKNRFQAMQKPKGKG